MSFINNIYRYIMAAVIKTNYLNFYYFKIYDTEKKELILKFERQGVFQKHTIYDYKVDPTNYEIFYFHCGIILRL